MACVGVYVLRRFKEELAWATDIWLQIISNVMLFKAVIPLKLKNKVVLSLFNIVCVAMWSLVTYSNCLVIYLKLMLHVSTVKVRFYV